MFLSKYWPSKALLWKDWRLSMPIFLLWAGFVTYISTLTFVYHLVSYRAVGVGLLEYWHGFREFHRLLRSYMGGYGLIMALAAIVLGAYLLGHERERGTLSLLASMPYSRRDILLSKALVALAQLSLPFVANALFMTVILELNRDVNLPFGVASVWTWAGHSVVVLSFVLGVTLLASTVSGKTWGAAFLALVMLFFPFGMYMLVDRNAGHWYRTGVMSPMWNFFGPWQDLVNDIASYLTIPAWLVDFPAALEVRSTTIVDVGQKQRVDLVFANQVWAFLHEHTYVLYLTLVGLSLGAYAWAQKWFAASRLEHDSELLVLPHLRGLLGIGFTACSALLGGAIVPGLLHTDRLWRLAMLLLSYAGSATLAWMLVCRFLGTTPASYSGAKRRTTTVVLLLVVAVLVGVLLAAMFGGLPRQLSSTQVVPLLALADAVMERRTAALVADGTVPLAALSNELASESPEFLLREQVAMAQLSLRREELRQRGEPYIRSEIQLTFIGIGSRVRQNTATITTRELGRLYFTLLHPNQPEYTAWAVYREFEFVRRGQRWELTATTLLSTDKGLPPPNEPGGV